MSWLQLTEQVPDEEGKLSEQTRVVEVVGEARIQIPGPSGFETPAFGELGLTKVEFFTEDPTPKKKGKDDG